MTPPVTAVVVTWQSAAVVADCLASLRRELPAGSEIVVIDNDSHDDTVAVVARSAPEAVVIVNPRNAGLAAANNQGLAAGRGGVFLICNPDTVFAPGSVAAMLAVLATHPRAAWVVPRLHDPDGTPLTSAGDLPTLRDALGGRQLARRRHHGAPVGFWWDGWDHATTRQIGRGHECAYLMRRAAVTDVGGQDERYVLDWEGFDWTDRLRRAGWEIWLAADADVVHAGGTSISQVPLRAVVSQHRGMYRYFADRRTPAWAWKPVLAAAFSIRAVTKVALTALGLPLYRWAHRGPRPARRAGPGGTTR